MSIHKKRFSITLNLFFMINLIQLVIKNDEL